MSLCVFDLHLIRLSGVEGDIIEVEGEGITPGWILSASNSNRL